MPGRDLSRTPARKRGWCRLRPASWLLLLAPLLAACPADYGGVPRPLVQGRGSDRELFVAFLQGLERRDLPALQALLVSREDYETVILPGSVPPGEPTRTMPEKKSHYFWAAGNTRSQYALAARLEQHGGVAWRLLEVRYPKPPERFASYTAHRNPVILVEGPHQRREEIELGSVAEVEGRFLFLSYFWD